MSNFICNKLQLNLKVILFASVGFLATVNPSLALDEADGREASGSSQPRYNIENLFQHIAENCPADEIPEAKGDSGAPRFLLPQPQPLVSLLKKSDKEAWQDVVGYVAKRDFILTALNSFRHLSKNELLHRMMIEKSSWKHHVEGIGSLLEEHGCSMVSDVRFGLPLQNLITSNYQITTFSSFKTLAQVVIEAKAEDPKLKADADQCQTLIKNYLEEHNLLRKE